MKETILILLSAVFVNNFVLSRFLGICPFLGVSKKLSSAVGMGVAVAFVMLMATAVTWPVYAHILEPQHLEYLRTLVFIVVIASLVQFVELALIKYSPSLHKALGVYLPLITTNCAILGVTILNVNEGYGFVNSMAHSLGAALGFTLALVIFAGIRERLELADVSPSFRGAPIALITAGLLALAFLGFSGMM